MKNNITCTVILSIYKDLPNLKIILHALQNQTVKPDQVIISEDGEDKETLLYLKKVTKKKPYIIHLTQEDDGFQKCKALNRSVIKAKNDYLIFIDGDCVPHKEFIRSHLLLAEKNKVCAGRRMELGPRFSKILQHSTLFYDLLHSKTFLLITWPLLLVDRVKNFEVGFRSAWLYKHSKNRKLGLLGCNFACFKDDLLSVNGFNEQYRHYGTGEDSDIEWRLNISGVETKNTKFLTPVFHLHHQKKVNTDPTNKNIFRQTKESNKYWTPTGIAEHQTQN